MSKPITLEDICEAYCDLAEALKNRWDAIVGDPGFGESPDDAQWMLGLRHTLQELAWFAREQKMTFGGIAKREKYTEPRTSFDFALIAEKLLFHFTDKDSPTDDRALAALSMLLQQGEVTFEFPRRMAACLQKGAVDLGLRAPDAPPRPPGGKPKLRLVSNRSNDD